VALEQVGSTAGAGVAFLVGGGVVYEIIAANCSSPQTTELNASARAETLMKYVNLGLAQSAVFIAVAMKFDPAHAKPILAGGLLAGALMYGLYAHAKGAGLASGAPPTEQHAPKASRGLSWNNPT
jgi:hypothetical protein